MRPRSLTAKRSPAGVGSAAARARVVGAEERVPGVGSGVTAEAIAGTVAVTVMANSAASSARWVRLRGQRGSIGVRPIRDGYYSCCLNNRK